MTLAISTALKNQILDGIVNAAAGINFNSGVLEIRSGAAPGPNAADAGTLLASVALPADAFGAAASGSAAKAGTWEDTSADGTGTAAHFRIKQTGDTGGATGSTDERIEGTVTVTGGGGDLTVDNTSFATGQQFTITAFSLNI